MGEEIHRKQTRSVITKLMDWLKKRSPKQIIIAVIVLLSVIWVAERLINVGTFFGYQVVDKDTSSKVTDDVQVKTFACTKLTTDEVSDVLGAKAKRIGGVFPDKDEPNFISNCSYQIGGDTVRSVSILVRDSATDKAADSAFEDLKKRNKYDDMPEFGDEAIFTAVSRQLNVKDGRRIVSVTVSDPNSASSISNKDAVVELYKKY